MAVIKKCPSCGLESEEIRCPRCNTLKVIGCSGSCTMCKTAEGTCSVKGPIETPPSEGAREDSEYPWNPLER